MVSFAAHSVFLSIMDIIGTESKASKNLVLDAFDIQSEMRGSRFIGLCVISFLGEVDDLVGVALEFCRNY